MLQHTRTYTVCFVTGIKATRVILGKSQLSNMTNRSFSHCLWRPLFEMSEPNVSGGARRPHDSSELKESFFFFLSPPAGILTIPQFHIKRYKPLFAAPLGVLFFSFTDRKNSPQKAEQQERNIFQVSGRPNGAIWASPWTSPGQTPVHVSPSR